MHHGHPIPFCQDVHGFYQLIIIGVPALLQIGQKEFKSSDPQINDSGYLGNLAGGIEQSAVDAKIKDGPP